MDKIMSTRVDEAVARQIDVLAGQLGATKKAIIEEAIRHYVKKVEVNQEMDRCPERDARHSIRDNRRGLEAKRNSRGNRPGHPEKRLVAL